MNLLNSAFLQDAPWHPNPSIPTHALLPAPGALTGLPTPWTLAGRASPCEHCFRIETKLIEGDLTYEVLESAFSALEGFTEMHRGQRPFGYFVVYRRFLMILAHARRLAPGVATEWQHTSSLEQVHLQSQEGIMLSETLDLIFDDLWAYVQVLEDNKNFRSFVGNELSLMCQDGSRLAAYRGWVQEMDDRIRLLEEDMRAWQSEIQHIAHLPTHKLWDLETNIGNARARKRRRTNVAHAARDPEGGRQAIVRRIPDGFF